MKEQVIQFEQVLNETTTIVTQLTHALETFANNQKAYMDLVDYYMSEDWQDDVRLSNETDFYKKIACGVLSEDAVYNLMVDTQQTTLKMLEIATAYLKNR